MSLLQSLKKYNDETPIHGVGFIPRSKTLREAAFWTCIVVIGVCMSINDLSNLIAFYNTEPMNVAIDIVKRSQFESPVPTICIDTSGINDLQKQDGTRYSEEGTNFTIPDQNITLMNAYYLVKAIKTVVDFDDDIQLQTVHSILNSTSNPGFLSLNYAMIGFLSSFEMLVSQYPYSLAYYAHIFSLYESLIGFNHYFAIHPNTTFYDVSYRPLVNKVFSVYRDSNVSLPDLIRVVGSVICRPNYVFMNTSITQLRKAKDSVLNETFPEVKPMTIFLPSQITHVSFSMICSKAGNGSFLSQDSYFFSIPASGLSPNEYRWHLDFQGRPFLPGDSKRNVYHWTPTTWLWGVYPQQTLVEVDVRIIQHVSMFNRKTKPCMKPLNLYNGESEQRAKYFFDQCGCLPLLTNFSRPYSDQPYCYELISEIAPDPIALTSHNYFYRYELKSNVSLNEREAYSFYRQSCSSDAVIKKDLQTERDCEMVEFEITERVNKLSDSSMLNVYMYDEYLTSLKESPQKNWSTFISEFGGSIGVWLGASLIAFLHIPIYIFNVLYDYHKAKRAAKISNSVNPVDLYDNENNQPVSEMWHSAIYGDDFVARAHRGIRHYE